MAVKLNKNRMLESWALFIICALLLLFTKPLTVQGSLGYEIIRLGGIFLVLICVMGRIFTTAFLGGHKNQKVINYGPFSVVRNPLYVFSIIGVMGVSLVSQRLGIIIIAPLGTIIIYHFLVKREEAFLLETFGQEYADFCEKVPRFIPNLGQYHAPALIETDPKRLFSSLYDALWWFLIVGIIGIIEHIHF